MPLFLLQSGPSANPIVLDRPVLILGRGADADIRLDHPSVSTHHCRLELAEGQLVAIDLNSTNGTFLDGSPIQQAVVTPGQTLRLGTLDLLCADDAAEGLNPKSELSDLKAAVPRPAADPRPIPTTSAVCKHHKKLPARFFCPQCTNYFCEACVGSRPTAAEKFCRHCGCPCHPVNPDLTPRPEATFFQQVPEAFRYPLRSLGVMHVFIAVILVMVLNGGLILMQLGSLRLLLGGILLQIFVGGYFFGFLQNIVHSSISGDRELPDLPGVSNAVDDLLLPYGRVLVLLLFALGPAVAIAAWGESVSPLASLFAWVALVMGLIYFPMGFLAVAVYDSVAAVNPLLVIPSILKTAGQYLFILVLLSTFFGLRWLGDVLSLLLMPEGISTKSVGLLVFYFALRFVTAMASLYMLLVVMNLLGRLYATNKERLGWLSSH